MSYELEALNTSGVDQSQLPAIVSEQFKSLKRLEEHVQQSSDLADKAKEQAKRAKNQSAGLFKKKAAIEELQDAAVDLAEAQISAADAQKISFEYQTKLTEITKYLFGLGVSNIAMNRSVVRELELRLKGASDDEISDLAKQELKNVILQLKAQEDVLKKQEFLTDQVKKQSGEIKSIGKQLDAMGDTDDEQNDKITRNAKKLDAHEKELSRQHKKDDEHDQKIAEHEETLSEQHKKDEEHDRKIAEHEETLSEQHKKDEEHDRRISENAKKAEQLEMLVNQLADIEEANKKLLSEKIRKLSDCFSEKLIVLENSSNNALNDAVFSVSKDIRENIDAVNHHIENSEKEFENKFSEISAQINDVTRQLNDDIVSNDVRANEKADKLSGRIDKLDTVVSRKVWKIAVSVVAVASLALNILQIVGVL